MITIGDEGAGSGVGSGVGIVRAEKSGGKRGVGAVKLSITVVGEKSGVAFAVAVVVVTVVLGQRTEVVVARIAGEGEKKGGGVDGDVDLLTVIGWKRDVLGRRTDVVVVGIAGEGEKRGGGVVDRDEDDDEGEDELAVSGIGEKSGVAEKDVPITVVTFGKRKGISYSKVVVGVVEGGRKEVEMVVAARERGRMRMGVKGRRVGRYMFGLRFWGGEGVCLYSWTLTFSRKERKKGSWILRGERGDLCTLLTHPDNHLDAYEDRK